MAAGVFVFTALELLLLEHTETLVQWIAFGLCALGLGCAVILLKSPSRRQLNAARMSAGVIILGTLYGIVEHVLHNMELELEIRPSATWMDVIWPSLTGAAPLLASGILIVGALLLAASTKESRPPSQA